MHETRAAGIYYHAHFPEVEQLIRIVEWLWRYPVIRQILRFWGGQLSLRVFHSAFLHIWATPLHFSQRLNLCVSLRVQSSLCSCHLMRQGRHSRILPMNALLLVPVFFTLFLYTFWVTMFEIQEEFFEEDKKGKWWCSLALVVRCAVLASWGN